MMQPEAEVLVEGWRKEYNRFRPHSSLGNGRPAPETSLAGKFTRELAHGPGKAHCLVICGPHFAARYEAHVRMIRAVKDKRHV